MKPGKPLVYGLIPMHHLTLKAIPLPGLPGESCQFHGRALSLLFDLALSDWSWLQEDPPTPHSFLALGPLSSPSWPGGV